MPTLLERPDPIADFKAKPTTAAQRTIALHGDAMTETAEEFQDEDVQPLIEDGAVARAPRVTTRTPLRVMVYKLTPTGCVPVEVSSRSLGGPEGVLNNGYSPVCFDCGQEDCCTSVKDWNPNQCKGRPPRRYRACPISSCRKRIYDSAPTGKYLTDDFSRVERSKSDENAIDDDIYGDSTPESRTKVQLDMHIIGYHPQQAMERGIKAPSLTVEKVS